MIQMQGGVFGTVADSAAFLKAIATLESRPNNTDLPSP
jgi:hypothetical protein